jgi:hypothetical protein
MHADLKDSLNFPSLLAPHFHTAKREGGNFIRNTPTGFSVNMKVGTRRGFTSLTYDAGDAGANQFGTWMNGAKEQCKEGAFTTLALTRVPTQPEDM